MSGDEEGSFGMESESPGNGGQSRAVEEAVLLMYADFHRGCGQPLEHYVSRFSLRDAAHINELAAEHKELTSEPVPPAPLEPPIERVGNFRLREEIGKGGFFEQTAMDSRARSQSSCSMLDRRTSRNGGDSRGKPW